ncbi:MAG: hypothetical protein AB1414_00065 [bacterium]
MAKKKKYKKNTNQQYSFLKQIDFNKNLPYLLWGGIVGILIFLWWHIASFNFVHLIDDAYISFRYADNFIHGKGLVYNMGERVEGYSNFLWVIILSGFMKVGLEPILISKISGIILSSATVMLTFRIARIISGYNFYALIPSLFLICSSGYVLWATGGLETHLFGFLITAGVLFYLKQDKLKNNIYSGCLFALTSLTRPEGILLALLTFGHKVLSGLTGRMKRYWRDIFLFMGGFLVIFLPYLAFKISYYGDIFPNTFYAKAPSNLALYDAGKFYLFEFLKTNFNLFLLLFFLLVTFFNFKKLWFTYIITLIIPFCIYILWIGGDSFPCFRFLVPLLPLFALLIGESFKELKDVLETRLVFAYNKHIFSFLIVGILVYSLYHSITSTPTGSQAKSLVTEYTKIEKNRVLISDWFVKRFPSSTSIALNPAGIIPYYTRFKAIDMLGLNDKHIAKSQTKVGSGAIGHLKFDSDYVISKKPDLIIIGASELLPGNIEREKVVKYYQFITGAIPGDRALLENRRLYEEYDLVAVKINEESFLPLFLSKKSPIKPGEKFGIVPVV